jgi:TPR repeat protein
MRSNQKRIKRQLQKKKLTNNSASILIAIHAPMAAFEVFPPFEGIFLEDSIRKAVRWYRKASDQGKATGQFLLGVMYCNGQGVSQDYKEAAKWFRKAAAQGNASALSYLGVMYYGGVGVPQDYKEAAKWFRKAAAQGHANAQYNLGVMYGNGLGVPQENIRAKMWFNLSAAQGDDIAREARNRVAKRMTADQISQAQKLAREWKTKKDPK